MRNVTLKAVLLIGLFILIGGSLYAQNFLDNEDYRKARDLQAQAEQARDEGDYDKAYELAQEAKLYSQKALAWAAMMDARFDAYRVIRNVERRAEYLEGIGADKKYPEPYTSATVAYDAAMAAFNAENYPLAKENAQKAFDILALIPDADTAIVEALPKYYVVRLIPEARDCFWRIAEYPFIYGDSSLGGIIYRANKDKLVYPDNPDLIYPGQVFLIPSIEGEARVGVFNPDDWDVDLSDPEVTIRSPGTMPSSVESEK